MEEGGERDKHQQNLVITYHLHDALANAIKARNFARCRLVLKEIRPGPFSGLCRAQPLWDMGNFSVRRAEKKKSALTLVDRL